MSWMVEAVEKVGDRACCCHSAQYFLAGGLAIWEAEAVAGESFVGAGGEAAIVGAVGGAEVWAYVI